MDVGEMALQTSASNEAVSSEAATASTLEPSGGSNTLDQPIGACSHCLMHSQLPQNALLLREAESSMRFANRRVPQLIQPFSLLPLARSVLDTREHAPPGQSLLPRHILVSVFRI